MMFEQIDSWDTIVNYNNFFRIECHDWLQAQNEILTVMSKHH